MVTKNTPVGGRRRGLWSAVGVASSNATQGAAAAAGIGAVIVRVEPLFEAVKWGGIAYLLLLGGQAFRSALPGEYPQQLARTTARHGRCWVGGRGSWPTSQMPRVSCSTSRCSRLVPQALCAAFRLEALPG